MQSSYQRETQEGEPAQPSSLEVDYEDQVQLDQSSQVYKVYSVNNEEVVYEGAINDLVQNNKKL